MSHIVLEERLGEHDEVLQVHVELFQHILRAVHAPRVLQLCAGDPRQIHMLYTNLLGSNKAYIYSSHGS